MMTANLNTHLLTHFFEFKFHTLKLTHTSHKRKPKVIIERISRQINQFVFVDDRDNIEPSTPSSTADASHTEESFNNTAAIVVEDNGNDSDSKHLTTWPKLGFHRRRRRTREIAAIGPLSDR